MADGIVVAVTGVSGFLGQRLLPLLDASPHVDRIVGLDIRDPARRARKLEFHRVDVLGTDLQPYLRDVSAIVHLAAAMGPLLDDALFTRVNVEGTRRVLDAATAAGVRKIVRPSSTAVYGAWANNPVPITEDAPLRPSPAYLPAIVDGECERLLAEWAAAGAGRIATRLRIAPIVGAGAHSLLTAVATGRAPVRVRGATPPVQVVHVDDAAAALELSDRDRSRRRLQRRRRRLARVRGGSGAASERPAARAAAAAREPRARGELGDRTRRRSARARAVPRAPVRGRQRSAQAAPVGSRSTPTKRRCSSRAGAPDRSLVPWFAGAGAVTAGAVLGTWWLTRRRERRSRR